MSRTKKGRKAPGFDFWSRRPKSSKNDKNLTHRAERAEAKEELLKDHGQSMEEIRREVDAMPEMFEDLTDSK